MKRYRIYIAKREHQTRAVMEVMKRGRITCLRGDEFIVPEPALGLLDEIGVSYKLMNEEPEVSVGPLRDPHPTAA